jgi:hypothetical protein
MLHHPREFSRPTWHLTSKFSKDSVHSPHHLVLIMSQLTSEIANLGSCMPDNSLDQLDLVDMAHMDLMMAIEVFVLARNGFFHVVKCCSESEGFGFDACGVVFQVSEGLVDSAIAVVEGETEGSRGVCHCLYSCVTAWYSRYVFVCG